MLNNFKERYLKWSTGFDPDVYARILVRGIIVINVAGSYTT